MNTEQYVDNYGEICPVCGAMDWFSHEDSLYENFTIPDVLMVRNDCVCGICGGTWTETYELTFIEVEDD